MKNFIKIVSSALIAILALSTVAFAAPSSGNGTGSGVGSAPSSGTGTGSGVGSVPSTGNGTGSGVGSVPSNGNGSGSGIGSVPSNGSGTGTGIGTSNGGTTGGNTASVITSTGHSSARINISLTNVNVTVAGSKATVTWDTTPSTQGMIIFGSASLATPNNSTEFYGYPTGMYADAGLTHSFTFTMTPGTTYFVRPVAILGMRVVFGSEIKVNGSTVTKKTAAPAVGTMFDAAPSQVKIETSIPADVEVSKAPSKDVANVASATTTSAFTRFFKRAWNSITSPFCN